MTLDHVEINYQDERWAAVLVKNLMTKGLGEGSDFRRHADRHSQGLKAVSGLAVEVLCASGSDGASRAES